MFSSSEVTKKIAIIATSICAVVFTIVTIITFIFSSDKQPFYIMIPGVAIYDIVWLLTYFFLREKTKIEI